MQAPAMTEVVDKSLIERLILEHSDRLELEINHKARADAWKFYFRVRIDHVLRPFAVCKVCYRVLHCDSRSGTASLLRHPCNPLSERSPVNRAVRLNAKLKLPTDNNALKKENVMETLIKGERGENDVCNSPAICPSPTITTSPQTQTTTRKRKAGPPPPAFPIDLQLLPQIMASVPHPLAALYIANAMNVNDPQSFQHLQQQIQQIQIDSILRGHQQQQLKEQQEQQQQQQQHHQQQQQHQQLLLGSDENKRWCGSPVEASSSSSLSVQSDENMQTADDPGGGGGNNLPKELVQHLVSSGSTRVTLLEKNSPSANGVWPRFFLVIVDGVPRNYATCKSCRKVVTYSRYTGTGGLLRHRCPTSYNHQNLTPPHDTSPPPLVRCDVVDDTMDTYSVPPREIKCEENSSTNPAMAGVARALLRYMCQDLVPGSSIDSPGFQQLVMSLINLGASHSNVKDDIQNIPSTQLLLDEHLEPLAAVSRDKSARLLQDQPHLCLSCHRPDSELLAVAAHFVTPEFQLKSHALGTRKVTDGDTTEDALTALLSECLQESPSLLRERRLIVVSDDGFSSLGTQVPCLWHATEKTLAELNKLPAYLRVSEDTTALLEFLADCGVPGASQAPRDTPRWEALLHALTFVAVNYDQVLAAVRAAPGTAPDLGDQGGYQELANLLGKVRLCLTSIRASDRPTLNQAVLCRAKLIHLCTAPANTTACKLLQEQLLPLFQQAFSPSPLHLVASFLDPRFKSLKVSLDSLVFNTDANLFKVLLAPACF
ncbi:hypothetical protein HAZT_HAZT007819 [Hyalella azteca]|uniref:BED-type domain-containing protein n=1 Tax=Hyalella azteca TaxID=294128 RepID=A0A6A0GWU6_HYAAZ|nr:hypothetical protein HAZT_HAZT007819 [Hyalella azteca]